MSGDEETSHAEGVMSVAHAIGERTAASQGPGESGRLNH